MFIALIIFPLLLSAQDAFKKFDLQRDRLFLKRINTIENKRESFSPKKKVTKALIRQSKKIPLVIQKGAILIDDKTDYKYRVQRELLSSAYSTPDESEYYFLVDKTKQMRFKVKAQFTESIKTTLNMHEAPTYFTKAKKPPVIDYIDEEYQIKTILELGVGIRSYAIASTRNFHSFVAAGAILKGKWNTGNFGLILKQDFNKSEELSIHLTSIGALYQSIPLYESIRFEFSSFWSVKGNLDTDILTDISYRESSIGLALINDYNQSVKIKLGFELGSNYLRGNFSSVDIDSNSRHFQGFQGAIQWLF